MWDIDLSDTDLDFLDADIPVNILSKRLEDILKTCLEDVFKTSSV